MHTLIAAALCAAFVSPAFASTVYEVDLINTVQSGIVAFEVAREGSDRFHPAAFVSAPLAEGGESATVRIRADDGGCRRDLRVHLADGSVVTHLGLNVCRRTIERAGESL